VVSIEGDEDNFLENLIQPETSGFPEQHRASWKAEFFRDHITLGLEEEKYVLFGTGECLKVSLSFSDDCP
jgi:hypothetical protein